MIADFLGKLLSIKPNERNEVFYFFLVLLVFSFGASFARSIGMTLLIEKLGGDKLPLIFIFIDLSVMVGSMLYAHYTNKFSGLDILGFFLLSTAVFSVIAQLLFLATTYWWFDQNWVYGFFFVGFFFFYILIFIHTGSVVASYFTAVQMKRVMPIINAGIPIGGVLGGSALIVLLNIFHVPPQQLILILGIACLGAFGVLRIINARSTPVHVTNTAAPLRTKKNPLSGFISAFKDIIGSKLMIYMSIGLILFVIVSKLLEYHYQTIIYYQVFPDTTERATFFATYEVFANLIWLFIQLFLTSRIVVKLGVGASNVLYPVLTAIASLGLLIYFFLKAEGQIANGITMMLFLGIFTQFINQEMRLALRSPVNNLLFNAIPPNQWGSNKAFLNGIVFPFATLIAGGFLIMITGDSSIALLNSISEEQLHYLLPLIALVISLLGIWIALPQSREYGNEMEAQAYRAIFGPQVDSKGGQASKSFRKEIQDKLRSGNSAQLLVALEMVRILKADFFLNQIGNLLLRTADFKIKKHCLNTLDCLLHSNANLNYLIEALRTEQDVKVLPLIMKNMAKFKRASFNSLVEKFLKHPDPSVFIEASLFLYNNTKEKKRNFQVPGRIEKAIEARLHNAKLQDAALYLNALGQLHQIHYSKTVSKFLNSDDPDVRLAAFTADIRLHLHENKLDSLKHRLIKALESPEQKMKIVALKALKDCRPLEDWSPIIKLLGSKDPLLLKEAKELLQLNLKVGMCNAMLVKQVFEDKISIQQRFETFSLVYRTLSSHQHKKIQNMAIIAFKQFIYVNALLKLHESMDSNNKTYDLITKVLQEISDDHLDHVLTILTFVTRQDNEFFQMVSYGLKSSNRANQGNALEVLSNVGEKELVNLMLKYYEERLNNIHAFKRVYFSLFSKPLKNVDKNNYKAQLFALNHDILNACLLYIEYEKTGEYQLVDTKKTVRDLLN